MSKLNVDKSMKIYH